MRQSVILITAITLLGSALGCMSFSFGERTEVVAPKDAAAPPDGCLEQTGKILLPPNEEITVYYPVPYVSPPNLVIESLPIGCRITDQKPDYFCVRSLNVGASIPVTWTARGVRAIPAPPPPPPAATILPPQTH